MSINGILYSHPQVKPAIDEASSIVDRWIEALDADDKARIGDLVTVSWERIDLVEKIAEALLARSGITDEDLDAFDEIYDEHCFDVSDAALFEMWDEERTKGNA